MKVDTSAAMPKIGHDHPKRRPSPTAAFAMTGRNVAGMM
jgi:hypothetical protein